LGKNFSVFSKGDEKLEIPGGRGEASYVQKCPECKNVGSADILELSMASLGGDTEGSESSVKELELAKLDCRGLEPHDFQVGDGWTVCSTSSTTVWEDVSFLEEDSFTEYDEKASAAVEVTGLKGVWKRI